MGIECASIVATSPEMARERLGEAEAGSAGVAGRMVEAGAGGRGADDCARSGPAAGSRAARRVSAAVE